MPKPKDGFKKLHRAGKSKDEIMNKNLNYFDLIDDTEDEDDGYEDSNLYDEDEDQ